MKTHIVSALVVFCAMVAAATSVSAQDGFQACSNDQGIEVLWNGSWYAASFASDAPNDQGQCMITYDGYDASWDEWVGPDRVRPAAGLCTAGGALDVLWNGSWYAATVLEGPNAEGLCYITYEGYDSSWDDWIGADRMRARSL